MPYLGLKRKFAKIWPSYQKGRKIVLLYHSLEDSPWALSKNNFIDHIKWIFDHCVVLSLTDLIHAKPTHDTQIALTFDDGYFSLYRHVLPILNEKKMVATAYINTGWIGETLNDRKLSNSQLGHYPKDTFLTWPEVRDLHNEGWEIGSHGVNHHDFTSIESDLIKKELSYSKYQIESQLSTTCMHFAYPYGKHSQSVKKIVQECGYQYAAGARHGSLSANSNLWAFPRINLANDYSFDDFKNIIQGKWDYLGWIHKIKRL